MGNAGLDESQAGIKMAGRDINNLRYTDDTTLLAEVEKELKSFLMRMKEEIIASCLIQFSSVSRSCPTFCHPHESQHVRPPCPTSTPAVYSNSCPSSWWWHPVISYPVVPFFSCPKSLPATGSFLMSQLFAWSGQSIGVSASAPVFPKNTQDWYSLGWTGWISLQAKELSRVFSNITFQKHQYFGAQLSSQSKSYIHAWPLEQTEPWLHRPWQSNVSAF